MKDLRSIAIIIPCFNEKLNIEKLVESITKYVPQAKIVVVDDNSPDGTADAVKAMQKKFPNLFLNSAKTKQGRGRAVLSGFKYAMNKFHPDIFLEMDGDQSHRPRELKRLIRAVNKNQVAIASRYLPKSNIVGWPWYRFLFSYLGNIVIRLVLGLKLVDNTNGLRAYPKEAVKILLKHDFVCRNYIVLSEIAVVLQDNQFKFIEVPSVFINRRWGRSNTNFSEVTSNTIQLYKLWQQQMDKKNENRATYN